MLSRAKVILTPRTAHTALGLDASVRVVGFHATVDPPAVHVFVEADWFNDNPECVAAPAVPLTYVQPT